MVYIGFVISALASLTFAAPRYPDVNYWFSFGDSYTATGFEFNGTQPSIGNPLGNPPYPGSTNVGGPNWVDAVTTVYNKSLILTYNFAYGGATIDANLVTPYLPTVKSLTDQVDQFLTTYADKPASAPWKCENTLFSVWIGINDIKGSWSLGGDRGAFSDVLIDAYFALVEKLYEAGARNFLFINVPPIQRSPLMIRYTDVAGLKVQETVIEGFNSRLAEKIASFEGSHPGVVTYQWDSYSFFTKILDDPTKYGFPDSTSYGSDEDFWGNDFHPSSPAQVLIGKDIAEKALGRTIW